MATRHRTADLWQSNEKIISYTIPYPEYETTNPPNAWQNVSGGIQQLQAIPGPRRIEYHPLQYRQVQYEDVYWLQRIPKEKQVTCFQPIEIRTEYIPEVTNEIVTELVPQQKTIQRIQYRQVETRTLRPLQQVHYPQQSMKLFPTTPAFEQTLYTQPVPYMAQYVPITVPASAYFVPTVPVTTTTYIPQYQIPQHLYTPAISMTSHGYGVQTTENRQVKTQTQRLTEKNTAINESIPSGMKAQVQIASQADVDDAGVLVQVQHQDENAVSMN